MDLETFFGKGNIEMIGKRVEFSGGVSYVEVDIKSYPSNQIISYYITETKKQPKAFKLITKYFSSGRLKVGDYLEFSFNVIKKKDGCFKLKIWDIYNIKTK
jgi:hypothetical protein